MDDRLPPIRIGIEVDVDSLLQMGYKDKAIQCVGQTYQGGRCAITKNGTRRHVEGFPQYLADPERDADRYVAKILKLAKITTRGHHQNQAADIAKDWHEMLQREADRLAPTAAPTAHVEAAGTATASAELELMNGRLNALRALVDELTRLIAATGLRDPPTTESTGSVSTRPSETIAITAAPVPVASTSSGPPPPSK